jgi:hypothetical protein
VRAVQVFDTVRALSCSGMLLKEKADDMKAQIGNAACDAFRPNLSPSVPPSVAVVGTSHMSLPAETPLPSGAIPLVHLVVVRGSLSILRPLWLPSRCVARSPSLELWVALLLPAG